MTPRQTREAINFLTNYDMSSIDIAKHLSGYKNAPRVQPSTISSLKGWLTKNS